MSFREIAQLLLPAEPGLAGSVEETDQRWALPAPATDDSSVLIWGRGPLLSRTPVWQAARSSAARERALRALRDAAPPSFHVEGVHRLPPPVLAGGRTRNRLRAALREGAMVELWRRPHVRRVLDAVVEEAGWSGRVIHFTPGSGGSLLARLPSVSRAEAILRVARSDAPGDPHRAADALSTLATLEVKQVPRLLGRGRVAGASWSTESELPGRRPARLARPVMAELASILAGFPRSEEPPTAHEEDLRLLAASFPAWGAILSQVGAEVRDVALAVPSVIRHGDLWAGNLLVRRRRLTGILDWDAWHPRSLPGVDLLHLVANDEALRSKKGVGEVWLRRPWDGEAYRSATSEYWNVARIVPNEPLLRAVGIAWWAGHVAASIRRLPRLAGDVRWVESNVERVIRDLAGSR